MPYRNLWEAPLASMFYIAILLCSHVILNPLHTLTGPIQCMYRNANGQFAGYIRMIHIKMYIERTLNLVKHLRGDVCSLWDHILVINMV